MHYTRVPRLSCRALFTLALPAALACLFLSVPACGKKKPPAPPPPAVFVVNVIQRDIPVIHEWVGATDGLVNASIRPQVTGYLIKQNYVEGDIVKKGQVLFEIDPRPFRAALDQAKGNLSQFTAQWENAKATLGRVQAPGRPERPEQEGPGRRDRRGTLGKGAGHRRAGGGGERPDKPWLH